MNIKQILLRYKLLRYFIIGGFSTLIHFLVASLFIYFVANMLLLSNIAGFLVAYLFSYTMQSKFVFSHDIELIKAIRYFLVQFGALLFAIAVSDISLLANNYIKTIFVIVIMPIITYTIHLFWTFRIK